MTEDLDPDQLRDRLQREREARQQAERIAESKTRELYETNESVNLLQDLAAHANEADDLGTAMEFALDRLCAFTGCTAARGYTLDPEADDVVVASGDEKRVNELQNALGPPPQDPDALGDLAGPGWTEDLAESAPDHLADARDAGFEAAVVAPIRLGGEPVAAVEMFPDDPTPRNEGTVDLLDHAVTQLGHVARREQARRQIERAREEAEEANRAKSAFLATMSHEIRTPMNAVIGMAQLLRDTRLEERQQEYVETIESSGQHLLALINDVLDFSKIEAGDLQLDERVFDLRGVIEDSMDLVRDQAAEKGLDLAYRMADDVPEGVNGDPDRLRQILVNLHSNAVKFTEQGEVVTRVEVLARDGDEVELLFEVEDTGIGIPEDEQDTLFGSFQRGDSSLTREVEGTGLGLAISSQLTDLMGGDMEVESTPDGGSAFRFTMPTTESEIERSAPDDLPGRTLESLDVLIVDDNETNRKILDHHARAWGMSPTVCAGPEEALEEVESRDFDLALLDQDMSGMQGTELAQRIAREHAPEDFPLILLSSVDPAQIGELPVEELDARLRKPVKPSRLYDTLLSIAGTDLPDPELEADDETLAERIPLDMLVAEDNPVNQRVEAQMLRSLGYEPEVVGNGREALEAVQQSDVDLVFMDLQMPEMDGIEATERIQEELDPDERPRIVAMTAHAEDEIRQEADDAGFDGYIVKPVERERLKVAIERAAPGAGDQSA